MPRPLRTLARGLLLVLALPAVGLANMADPSRPGDAPGEPSAALAGLVVAHESLRVDLSASPATVEAVYTLRNDSTAREVALEFVALGLTEVYDDSLGTSRLASGDGRYTVTLDGEPVEAEATDSLLVPQVWVGDVTTPRIGGGSRRYATAIPPVYAVAPEDTLRTAPGFRFTLPLASGESEVRVRYPVQLGLYDDPGHPRPLHQFAYSLAPARRWAGVGTLDVEVVLPAGVEAASTPALVREGDRLTGSFQGIPADLLTVSYREPAPLAFRAASGGIWVWVALCLLVAPLAFGRRQRPRVAASLGRGAAAAILAMTGAAVLLMVAGSFATTPWGYGFAFSGVLLALPLFLSGMVVYALVEQVAGRLLARGPTPSSAP
ncbi:MAG: hypothetical protein AAFQ43_00535 [Bacteroidota bacterium]